MNSLFFKKHNAASKENNSRVPYLNHQQNEAFSGFLCWLRRASARLNWGLFIPAFLLTSLGLLSIYSSSLQRGSFFEFKKQLIFFGVSLAAFLVLSFLDLRALKASSHLVLSIYLFFLAFLFGLFFFGTRIRGIKGWYRLGPLSFDPVPFTAFILVIILAKYFSSRHTELERFQTILHSAFYAFWPVLLVFFQPDLGSALILAAVWLGMVIFSGIKLRHLFILSLIFLLLFVLGWKFALRDYQKQRILSFLNPQEYQQGASWSVNQSKIAIGSGGLFGKGIGKGSQTQYGFLPEPKTDFIFSAIAEEMGFLGIFFLFSLFVFLLWRIIRIAFLANDNFTRLFALGFTFLILSQSFINIGMSLGLFPVIGIPLPFVSYGGSMLLAFYSALGILVSLERRG